MIKFLLSLTIFASGLTAFAQNLEEARKKFDEAKYSEVEKILMSMNPMTTQAKGFICQLYAEGKISPNLEKSSKLCDDAVAEKDKVALYHYALAYINGNDSLGIAMDQVRGLGFMSVAVIDLDFPPAYDFFCRKFLLENREDMAVHFCKLGASKGMRYSMYQMAQFFISGKGVIQNYKNAKTLLLASAARSYPDAFEALAQYSSTGEYGFALDKRHAYAWYTLSMLVKPDPSKQRRRDALGLTPADIEQAQKLATNWKHRTPTLMDYSMQ